MIKKAIGMFAIAAMAITSFTTGLRAETGKWQEVPGERDGDGSTGCITCWLAPGTCAYVWVPDSGTRGGYFTPGNSSGYCNVDINVSTVTGGHAVNFVQNSASIAITSLYQLQTWVTTH